MRVMNRWPSPIRSISIAVASTVCSTLSIRSVSSFGIAVTTLGLRRQMRRVGQFQYVVALPDDIDPEQVEASLHDGVLAVRLGKAAASQPRQIEVRES